MRKLPKALRPVFLAAILLAVTIGIFSGLHGDIAAPGALYRDVYGRLVGWLGGVVTPVDSRSYNMVADGTTDWTSTLQKAVNDAAASPSHTLLIRSGAVTYIAVLTSGSTTVVLPSTSGLYPGMLVAGPGIQAGTTVSSISGFTVTLSSPATNPDPLFIGFHFITFIGTYNFSGTVVIPAGIRIMGESTPGGNTNGYTPWGQHPFLVRWKFTGSGIAWWLAYWSSNHFENIELFGTDVSTSVGLRVANSMSICASTNSSTSLTDVTDGTGPTVAFSAQPAPGMIINSGGFGDLPAPVTLTVTLTSGSPTFSVGSTTGLASGMVVMDQDQTATAIPNGTTISLSGSTVTMSANSAVSGSRSVTFWPAIVSYNAGTGTIVMSNAATGTHASTIYDHQIFIIDSGYPSSDLLGFGGSLCYLDEVSIHDFGVDYAQGWGDGFMPTGCYFGNAVLCGVVLQSIEDSDMVKCYIGGNASYPYTSADAMHICQGNGITIRESQFNQCRTAIFGTSASVTIDHLSLENVGAMGVPQFEFHNQSEVDGNKVYENVVPAGEIPLRSAGSEWHVTHGPVGGGVSATGTLTSGNNTITSISSGDIANLRAGMVLFNSSGIPANTYITAVGSTTVTLSANATASATESVSAVFGLENSDAENKVSNGEILPFYPICLTDGSWNVTTVYPPGDSATRITRGTPGFQFPAAQLSGTVAVGNGGTGATYHAHAVRTSDLSRASTITLTDDTQLIADNIPVGIWHVHGQLVFVMASATPGFSVHLAFTGTDAVYGGVNHLTAANSLGGIDALGAFPLVIPYAPGTATPFTDAGLFGGNYNQNGNDYVHLDFDGVINVTVAGNLSLQWSQNTSSTDTTVLMEGSTLWVDPF